MPDETATNDVDGTASGMNNSDTHAAHPANTAAAGHLRDLQTEEHADLLSAIDKVRHENGDADISIPQIVVCGDQSSGKSAVLEAIANVPFPVNAGTTTRFATELILRHAPTAHVRASIKLSPNSESNEDSRTQERRRAIEAPFEMDGIGDFGRVIQLATERLEQVDPDAKFWSDWLCVEISGPEQLHLTLVDLPGIIHHEREGSAIRGDGEKIKRLIQRFIDERRTIVLAVMDASKDRETQEIWSFIDRSHDIKQRTLGVLTHPDKLDPGSDMERRTVEMAKNEENALGQGWHILRNMPHDSPGRSTERRDELERQLFAYEPWSSLNSDDLGIESLRRKLSKLLFKCITANLSELIEDMQTDVGKCDAILSKLGPSREAVGDQRQYLYDRLHALQTIIKDAINGNYWDSEYSYFFNEPGVKRLRDKIRSEATSFASTLRKSGHQYNIYLASSSLFGNPVELVPGGERRFRSATNNHIPDFYSGRPSTEIRDDSPLNITLLKYCTALADYMAETQGRNPAGIPSRETIHAIFIQQSVLWERLAQDFAERCCVFAADFLKRAASHVADSYLAEALEREYIRPDTVGKRKRIREKVDELWWPFKNGHHITYSSKPTTIPRVSPPPGAGQGGGENDSRKTWGDLAREKPEFTHEKVCAADALELAESYYNVALETFIENVPTLAVERCLVQELPKLLPPRDAWSMQDEQVTRIAREADDARRRRATAERQKKALEGVIAICQGFVVYDSAFRNSTVSQPEARSSQERTGNTIDRHSSDRGNVQSTNTTHSLSGQSTRGSVPNTQPPVATSNSNGSVFASGRITSDSQGHGFGNTSGGLFTSTQPQQSNPFGVSGSNVNPRTAQNLAGSLFGSGNGGQQQSSLFGSRTGGQQSQTFGQGTSGSSFGGFGRNTTGQSSRSASDNNGKSSQAYQYPDTHGPWLI